MGKNLSDEEFDSAMNTIDRDGSGELDFVEFHAWFQHQEHAAEGSLQAAPEQLVEADADAEDAVFKIIEEQLKSGCVALPAGVFHFAVTDPANDTSPPEFFSINTTTIPGTVVRGDPRPKSNASFCVNKQELLALAAQLSRPSHLGDAQAMVDGLPVEAALDQRPASGKGKKGKGKKGKGANLPIDIGAKMLWEQQSVDGHWKAMPESVCSQLEALRNGAQPVGRAAAGNGNGD